MKRAISIFGALAALAVGFLISTPEVKAQTITCANVPSSLTTWPYSPGGGAPAAAQRCGTATTQKGSSMAGVLRDFANPGSAPNAYNQFAAYVNSGFAGSPRQFFIFGNYDEYVSFFDANYGFHDTPSGNPYQVPGFTARGATTGAPRYTVVFQKVKDDFGVYFDQPNLQNTVAHEAGHWVDYFYRTTVSGNQRASNSAAWTTLINHDWSHNSPPPNPYPVGVNQHANCQATPVGMFRGYKDANGVYICTGATGTGGSLRNPPYSGTNQNVLQLAYPHIYAEDKEIFAEEFAVMNGLPDSGLDGASHYMTDTGGGARFVCTKYLVQTLMQTGVKPTNTQLATKGCPAIP